MIFIQVLDFPLQVSAVPHLHVPAVPE